MLQKPSCVANPFITVSMLVHNNQSVPETGLGMRLYWHYNHTHIHVHNLIPEHTLSVLLTSAPLLIMVINILVDAPSCAAYPNGV